MNAIFIGLFSLNYLIVRLFKMVALAKPYFLVTVVHSLVLVRSLSFA